MGHTKMYFPFGALSLVPQIAAFHKKLHFGGKLKAYILKVLLRESERITCVGKEYITTVLIYRHIGVLAALEIGELSLVVGLNPASLMYRDRLPTALCTILVLKTILDNLELKSTHRADNLTAVKRRGEELCNALIHKLVDALCKLLELHRVGIFDIAEVLRSKRGDTCKLELLALGEGVANHKGAGVVKTYDIAGVCLVDNRNFLGLNCCRRSGLQLLDTAHMQVVFVTLKHTRTYLHKGDTVAVVGVHIGVNLEDETRKFCLARLNHTILGSGTAW